MKDFFDFAADLARLNAYALTGDKRFLQNISTENRAAGLVGPQRAATRDVDHSEKPMAKVIPLSSRRDPILEVTSPVERNRTDS